MSHSMSPPPKPAPAPTSYTGSNYPSNASPTNPSPFAPPPAKRQRMSPDARSPPTNYTNGAYRGTPPNVPSAAGGYGNPYAPSPNATPSPYPQNAGVQQTMPVKSFNTPDAYPGGQTTWHSQPPIPAANQQRGQHAGSPPGREMMPPPPRPNREEREERVGVDDINDALFSSGINLKDEENYLHSLYNNRNTATDSFTTHQGSSFGSTTLSQGGSFNLLTQGTSFSSQPNGANAGTLGPAASQDSVEEELRHKRTLAARKKAETDQHHLKNPFLLGNVLRVRCDRVAKDHGVRLDVNGLYVLQPEAKVMMNGDNSEGIVEAKAGNTTESKAKAGSMIETSAPFADVLSLISLACGERARALLDDTYGLARARRYADQGRVPLDFKDVATGTTKSETEEVIPESITGTPWDQVPEGMAERPQSTISFQSAINNELRKIALRDQEAEKARIRKREARGKAAEAASSVNDDTAGLADANMTGDAAGSTPGTPSEPQRLTKKEAARQQKERNNLNETQAATTTNQTAALMAMGKKGSKYSWMSGGAASMPTNRFVKPGAIPSAAASGTATPAKKDGGQSPVPGLKKDGTKEEQAPGMTWGEWREKGEGGRGLQVRDWVLVLERDGREKKALEKAKLRMGSTPDTGSKKAL